MALVLGGDLQEVGILLGGCLTSGQSDGVSRQK